MIVPEDVPMEDAKVLAIYWHEKQCSATKMSTKSLARAGEACSAYSTITNWIRDLTRGEPAHGHASGGGRLPDDRVNIPGSFLFRSSFLKGSMTLSANRGPFATIFLILLENCNAQFYSRRKRHHQPRTAFERTTLMHLTFVSDNG
jgi:hypothetical protein